MTSNQEMDASSPEVFLTFYRRIYPFKSLFNWLNQEHVPTRRFIHREFAFNLPGDIYIRYNSFTTAEELKNKIIQLNPSRFEIGAVYSARPRDKKTLPKDALKPLQRELVFDIDMTDYDEIRTCCSGKGICKLCWGFIAAAVKVIDNALREQFGYSRLLWVYSGRRGIHCWVSDEEAMGLTDEQRKAVMGWLEVIKGGKDTTKKVNVRLAGRPTHPAIQSAIDILKTEFPSLILEDQDCFTSGKQSEDLLTLLSDKEVIATLRKKWEANPERDSEDRWMDIKKEADKRRVQGNPHFSSTLMPQMEDIILQYTYPRFDMEVSKRRNHLLKAPFCVHPATGRVCVPVDPARVGEFDPEKVPTVGSLLKELDEALGKEEGEGGRERNDWEKTSLKPYVEMLDRHAESIMGDVRTVKREQESNSMEF